MQSTLTQLLSKSTSTENYNHMNSLLNELSLYIMFGLGFLLIRYASHTLGSILTALMLPFLYEFPKKPSSWLFYSSKDSEWKDFLKDHGYSHLVKSVQTYNSYIKLNGINSKNPFQVLEDMRQQDISPDIATYNTLLDICFKDGQSDLALNLFYYCCNSCSEVSPDVITFNIYIKGLLIQYNKDKKPISNHIIQQVLQEMARFQIKANEITYNTIIDLHVSMGKLKEAWKYFEEMKAKGIIHDVYTYSILVKGIKHSDSSSYDENVQILNELFNHIIQYIQSNKGRIDDVLFNTLIDAAAYYQDFGKLQITLETMRKQKVKPSIVTYGILIKAYGQNNMIERALEIYKEMQENGLQPNEITYGILIDSCIRAGRFEKAKEFCADMKNKKMPINIIICTTLVKGYSKQKEYEEMWKLYERVAVNRELIPNIIFYNAIIEGIIQWRKSDLLLQVFNHILKDPNQIKPDVITYSTLIKGFCKEHDMNAVINIYEHMSEQGIKIEEVLYNSILHGLQSSGKYFECERIYKDMISKKISPSNITYSIIIKLYTKMGQIEKALGLLEVMKINIIKPGVIVYTCLIQACIKTKRIARAIELFELAKCENPQEIDQVMYNTIVNGCVYAGKLINALTYLHWAIIDNIVLVPDIYNNVLKNILTCKTMAKNEKKVNGKFILNFVNEKSVVIDEDIKFKIQRIIDGTKGQRETCYEPHRNTGWKVKYTKK